MVALHQPSEPILAHTSAKLTFNPETRLGVVEQSVRAGFEGCINAGDMGELTAAIILLFSFDEPWKQETEDLPAAIPLTNFLGTLLGGQAVSDVVECDSTNKDMRSLRQWGSLLQPPLQTGRRTRPENPPEGFQPWHRILSPGRLSRS